MPSPGIGNHRAIAASRRLMLVEWQQWWEWKREPERGGGVSLCALFPKMTAGNRNVMPNWEYRSSLVNVPLRYALHNVGKVWETDGRREAG